MSILTQVHQAKLCVRTGVSLSHCLGFGGKALYHYHVIKSDIA